MNDLLESEEAPLPQAALQQWLQKLDVGWNKLLEMWESRREVLVQAHIFHLFLRDVKQAESFLNNQVRPANAEEVVGGYEELFFCCFRSLGCQSKTSGSEHLWMDCSEIIHRSAS